MHVRYVKGLFRNIQKQLITLKLAYFLRNLQPLRSNNLRILRTKNAKFSGIVFI